jgi:hypothetical protein
MDTNLITYAPEILVPDQPLDVALCSMASALSNNIARYSGKFLNASYIVTTSGNVGIAYTGASTTAPLGAKYLLTLGYKVPVADNNTLIIMANMKASAASRFKLIVYVFDGATPYIFDTATLQAQINNCIYSTSLAVDNTSQKWQRLALDLGNYKSGSGISVVLSAGPYTTSSATLTIYGLSSYWLD